MLFILNRQEKVVGVLKNSGKNSVPFFNDLLTEDLATGSETFEFTTVSRNGVGQHLVVGNFIAFKKGKSYKLFQIMQTEENHQDELYITVYAECAGLQLINSVFRGVKIVSASFERVMQTLLSDTSWNVGILPYGLTTTYDLDIEQASVYSLLQTYAQQYGVELEFRVELNRGKISKKYIDGYYNRGKVTGKRFTYERDIEGIVRKTDATELYTALIGRGNNEISFKDVTVDGIDKPMGQDFVANQSAYEKYNNNGYHIVGIYECDTDDAKDLLRKTHKRLLEVSEPKVEYDISVLLLCELLGEKWNEVAIGDTISVFDNAFYPPIMVSARVSKLQTSMTDKNANKCTLANFIEVKSNITSEMRKIASQLQGYVDNRFPIGSSDIQDGAVGMDKISDIYTQTITTDILRAGKVETEKLIAKEAEITNAKIENLKAGFIEADKIITDTIVANKAELDILEAKVGKIDTLVSGNISSDNIQTGGITGSNLNMDTIFVKDANILDLSASKLTAGEINTSKVVISSADGGMRLVGSTQQFVDENNRIRIQLGKDANGDFDFYILAENGDILFNTRGITGNAIENGLIKENMVSDGAIGGKKINWSSFVTEFNKDSNTHKLNSSKVLLDGTNQTLDIHFNRLNSTVNDNVNKTESNTTQLNVHQGKINTLIQDTTITKDGKNVKLKDEYSKLEQTVGGLKSTVGEQQTTINQNTGKITATESKVSTLEQTVNGFNSELSHVKTTIDEQEETINSVNSALSGKANSNDVYKKSETMTTSAINSAINQSADSIKLGISETYETKTNVETKVTTTLNSAKSYADTKKQEAISTASTDATNKVNSAKNELNTAINKKANSVDVYKKTETYTKSETDSKIKVAKDEINLNVSNTYETKTNVETKVNNAVNNIQIGGRNIATHTNQGTTGWSWGMQVGGATISEVTENGIKCCKMVRDNTAQSGWSFIAYSKIGREKYLPSKQYTISFEVKSSVVTDFWCSLSQGDGSEPLCVSSVKATVSEANTWTKLSFTLTTKDALPTSTGQVVHLTSMNSATGVTYIFRNLMIEEGTKASSWSPSPEDVDASINDKASKTDVYKKSETYTKSETDSKINIAKDNINLSVSNTYETKTNVESKISSAKTDAINTSKSYADTKKSEAITQAGKDADSKVATAKSDLQNSINTKANKTDVYTKTETTSQINLAKDSITNTVAQTYLNKNDALNTYATKSSLTQTANSITAKFEASGGYNLLKNSKGQNGTNFWLNNGGGISVANDSTYGKCFKTQAPSGIRYHEPIKLKNNTEYVYEGYIYSKTAIGGSGVVPLHYWCMSTADTAGQSQLTVLDYRQAVPTVDKWTKCYVHFRTASSGDVYFTPFVYVGGNATFDFLVTELSLSESSVESKWTPHPDEIYSGSTVIDATGVTVNNGALRVKNNAGNTVLSGDSAGNLTLTGTIKSEAGNGQYVSVNSGGITFKDSQKSEEVLRLNTSSSTSNRDINGVTFAMPQYADYLSFRHIAKPSLENGWGSGVAHYTFMDMWATDFNDANGNKQYKGVNVYAPTYLSQKIKFRNGGDPYLHEVTPNITWNNMNKLMGVYGDNGTVIGYKAGDNLQARIVVTEGNHPGTADVIRSWGHWNCSGAIVHNATFRGSFVNSYANPVTRTFSETSSIMTEGNQVRVNLENIQIKNGKAIMNIPKKYRGINEGYIIASIVKKGKGDVWVSEEEEERFIIEAENDIKINIEIIIKLTETAVARTLKHEDAICYEVPNKQLESDCC